MKLKTGLLFVGGVSLLSLTGCVDQDRNLFDAEATAAAYAEAFPVSNIDPDQDWKTTTNVSLSIAVEEDEGVNYTVRVFTDNPLSENTAAKLLAKGVARKGQPYVSTFDVPNSLGGVYITRTDDHNRSILHYAGVENGAVATVFGSKSSTRSSRANSVSRVKTRSGESIPERTPYVSESEVRNMLSSAVEYYDGLDLWTAGKQVAKVSKGQTVTFTQSWLGGPESGTYLIVEGKLVFPNGLAIGDSGVTICILDGGEVESSNLKLKGYASFIVFKGGKLTNNGKLDLGSCQYKDASRYLFYNDGTVTTGSIIGSNLDLVNGENGTITTESIELNNGGDCIMNYGTASYGEVSSKIAKVYNASTGVITGTQFESPLVNYGEVTIDECDVNYNQSVYNGSTGTFTVTNGAFHGSIENDGKVTIQSTIVNDNNSLINNCNFYCAGDFRGDITTSPNTKTYIGGDLYTGYTRTLAENSMIEVGGTADLNSATIIYTGSEDGHALLKAHDISGFQLNTSASSNPCNVYFEYDVLSDTRTGTYGEVTYSLNWLSGVGGSLAKTGDSGFVLPAGDCTGEGVEPNDNEEDVLEEIESQNYVYAFEDNYPYAGDYDFNDLVLDVTINHVQDADNNNAVTGVDIAVTLKAIGAINTDGAAIRLYGIDANAIGEVTFSGDTDIRNTLAGSQIGNEAKESGAGKYVVIPLFGDAHKALGLSEHVMTNTGLESTAAPKTLNVHIATSERISKDNLDIFITNGKIDGSKRVEIHLNEFLLNSNGNIRDDAATDKGSVSKNNAEILSEHNYTWALAVPGFKYPKEYTKITDAYLGFEGWAKNKSNNQDWYKSPVEGTTYEE